MEMEKERKIEISLLRAFLNQCLETEEFSGGAAMQQLVLMALSKNTPGRALESLELHHLVQDMFTGLDSM